MAEELPFGEGASINRPPLFCGLNYQFWKVKMKIFVESLDRGIWDAIENSPFIPKFENDDVFIEKPWSQWTDDENKRAKFDCIAQNIITYALNSKEFFRVSKCEFAKEMWDTLKAAHESINEIKKARTRSQARRKRKHNKKRSQFVFDGQKGR